MEIIRVTNKWIHFKEWTFWEWFHGISDMEYKCYRMLKAIHGKEKADEAMMDLIMRDWFVPPRPIDVHDRSYKYQLDQ